MKERKILEKLSMMKILAMNMVYILNIQKKPQYMRLLIEKGVYKICAIYTFLNELRLFQLFLLKQLG